MQLTGQITVVTAGTAVQGPSVTGRMFRIKALPGNSAAVYVGNDGNDTISSGTGYVLNPGDEVVFPVRSLSDVWFDAAVDGQKACWAIEIW